MHIRDESNGRITRRQRETLNGHRSGVIYLTGLSGAGKTTLAASLEQRLHTLGVRTCMLDGDELRTGLTRGLGFSRADRAENVRRAAEAARLMVDAGLVVISALISPFACEREAARSRFEPAEFMEVFVDAPLAVCEERDPKGLYKRARRGELPGFTGIDSPYEIPACADLRIDTTRTGVQEGAALVLAAMRRWGFFSPP